MNKSGSRAIETAYRNIQLYEHRNVFNLGNYQSRKIDKIRIGKLTYRKGNIVKVTKRVTIAQFQQLYSINGSTRIAGIMPDYIGYKPGKFVHPNHSAMKVALEYAKDKNTPTRISNSILNVLANPREIYQGAPDTNFCHLKNFFNNDNGRFVKISALRIIEIAKMSTWIRTPKLKFDIKDIDWITGFNKDSNPGHYTSKIFSTNYKSETISAAVVMAKELFNQITMKPIKNYSIWDILAREKDNKVGYLEQDYSTRVIMNPEHHVTLLLSWITQRFQFSCEQQNENPRFYLDREYRGYKANKILNEIIDKYDYIVDSDWTLFDSSQEPEFLLAATAILFSNSICGEDEDINTRIFYWYAETLITKFVAVPPGIVVELKKGLPSGHPGVTLINCLVNILRWTIIGYEIYGEHYQNYMNISVYGDDAIVGLNNHQNLYKIDEICAKYNFKGDEIYPRLYPGKIYHSFDEDKPDFLKRRSSYEGITWNYDKIYQKIFYPSRKRTTEEKVDLINNFIVTAPNNQSFNDSLIYIRNNSITKKEKIILKEKLEIKIDYDRFIPIIDNNYIEGYLYDISKTVFNTTLTPRDLAYKVSTRLDFKKTKLVYYFSSNALLIKEFRSEHNYVPLRKIQKIARFYRNNFFNKKNTPDFILAIAQTLDSS